MGRVRRRKTRYTWFPQIGAQGSTPGDDTTLIRVQPTAVASTGDPSDPILFPVIPDAPNDTPATNAEHLSDFIASEYVLRRIVGNYYVGAPSFINTVTQDVVQSYAIAVGFFVARCDDEAAGFTSPIGATTVAERRQNYGPLAVQTTREPWIWRRTWVLSPRLFQATTGAPAQATTTGVAAGNYPANNYTGSVAEGSKVDAKTVRRVRGDERLFMAVQSQILEVDSPSGSGLVLGDHFMDLRFLGALRKATQRGVF